MKINYLITLPCPIFGTVMVSLTFYGKNIETLKFKQPKYSNKNQMTEQK